MSSNGTIWNAEQRVFIVRLWDMIGDVLSVRVMCVRGCVCVLSSCCVTNHPQVKAPLSNFIYEKTQYTHQ